MTLCVIAKRTAKLLEGIDRTGSRLIITVVAGVASAARIRHTDHARFKARTLAIRRYVILSFTQIDVLHSLRMHASSRKNIPERPCVRSPISVRALVGFGGGLYISEGCGVTNVLRVFLA